MNDHIYACIYYQRRDSCVLLILLILLTLGNICIFLSSCFFPALSEIGCPYFPLVAYSRIMQI